MVYVVIDDSIARPISFLSQIIRKGEAIDGVAEAYDAIFIGSEAVWIQISGGLVGDPSVTCVDVVALYRSVCVALIVDCVIVGDFVGVTV